MIVVGGGHNGLISAALFAQAGARVVVLEARERTGGCTDTSAPWPEHPDFKVSTYSYVSGLMPQAPDPAARARPSRAADLSARPLLPGVSRRSGADAVRGPAEEPREPGAVLGRRRGGLRPLRSLAGRHRRGALADVALGAAAARLTLSRRPARLSPARLEGARAGRARRRRPDAAVHDERRRDPRRVVRERRDQGAARQHGDDRRLGGAAGAGDGLHPLPPLDGRPRRRVTSAAGASSAAAWAASPPSAAAPPRHTASRCAPRRGSRGSSATSGA